VNFLIILSIVLFVNVGIFLALEDRICAELRWRYGEVWKAIGSPERVFDDGGMARWIALSKLHKSPELLRQCSAELVRKLKLRKMLGRIYLGCVVIGVVAVIILVYFGII
jgi:hypothetical protein